MLKIEGRTFMNIQEAVQWLLDNNALPFQSSANYIANTEIGLGTIVNPSPAKVRIGSLIFFADSKVSTVIGLTENGFIVSDQYNDLVDDVAYVSSVDINASGHLITTFSDGQTKDAGLIKQVLYFGIDASQHLIAYYNDGTSTDLGAIFNGNITIAGDLTVGGTISGVKIESIKDANGHNRFIKGDITIPAQTGVTQDYGKWALSGTHLLIVVAGTIEAGASATISLNTPIEPPSWVKNKIYSLGSGNNVAYSDIKIYNNGTTAVTSRDVTLIKSGSDLYFYHENPIGDSDNSISFRVQFDLLIDNA